MKKSKAILVTVIISILLLCCLACCWALDLRAPVIISICALAGCGLGFAACRLCSWLIGETELDLPEISGGPALDPVTPAVKIYPPHTYEEIRDELREEARS